MKLFSLTLGFAAVLASGPVAAQSTGLYFRGIVAADYVSSSGVELTDGLVDLTFGVAPSDAGSFGGIGFEAGVWGWANKGGATNFTGFAALTFDIAGGRLHVGAPRPGATGFNTNPYVMGAPVGLLVWNHVFGHVPTSTFTAAILQRPMVGVRFERSSSTLSYALSYHQFEDVGTVNVLSFGASRDMGSVHVFGTAEHQWDSANRSTRFILGGSTTLAGLAPGLAEVEVGGTITRRIVTGNNATFLSGYVTLPLSDRLSVTGTGLYSSFGTIYALNAGYDVWNGLVLNAGVARDSSGGGSTFWTVGLSRNF